MFEPKPYPLCLNIFILPSSMVERTAHNGQNIGSTPMEVVLVLFLFKYFLKMEDIKKSPKRVTTSSETGKAWGKLTGKLSFFYNFLNALGLNELHVVQKKLHTIVIRKLKEAKEEEKAKLVESGIPPKANTTSKVASIRPKAKRKASR
jgi:hypothetical protein